MILLPPLRVKSSCTLGQGSGQWGFRAWGYHCGRCFFGWATESSGCLSPDSGQGLGLWLRGKVWVQV